MIKTAQIQLPLLPGYAYWIPTECEFSSSCVTLEKLFFHFSVLNFEQYDLFSGVDKIYSMPYSQEEYENLRKNLKSHNAFDLLKLEAELLRVLVLFTESASLPERNINRYSELLIHILQYIQSNTSISLRVEDIAKALYVSESKVRNVFRTEMQMPIGQYIDDLVFMQAKHLLSHKNMPLSQISATLGFCDQFYFSRRFKEKFGQPPTQFRKKIH